MSFVLTLPSQLFSYIQNWRTYPRQLTLQLQQQGELDLSLFQKVLSYLSSHEDHQLQEALSSRLTEKNLIPLTASLISTSPHLVETCLKVISLESLKKLSHMEAISQHASNEALFMPHPMEASLRSKLSSSVVPNPGLVNKVATYFMTVLTWAYSVDIDHFKKERIEAHILICYLAYAVARYTQSQMKSYEQPMSIEQLREALVEVEASIMSIGKEKYKVPSKMTSEAEKIYRAMGISRGYTATKMGEKCSGTQKMQVAVA